MQTNQTNNESSGRRQNKGRQNLLTNGNGEFDSLAYGKIPPQAKDLEKAILGSILLEPKAFERVSDLLTKDCFYLEAHQHVFEACLNLLSNHMPIDVLTAMQALMSMGKLDIVGGPTFLTSLTNHVTHTAHIETYAQIVVQKYMQRELIKTSGEVISDAYNDETDVFDLFDKAEANLMRISKHFNQTTYLSASELAVQNVIKIEALQNREIELTGVPTGFRSLDNLTCGWQPTDLIILAARPSVGKSAFALNLAINAAVSPIKKSGVGFFSLEMSSTQLVNRIVSYLSKVPLERIVRGTMDVDQLKKYYEAMELFSQLNFFIDETPSLNIHQFRTKARQMVNKQGVTEIIIDYLQLMSGEKDRTTNREQEISTITRQLKALAKELNVPIIALSQLNRQADKEEPCLSHLRESGAIEQDADVVGFLMRDDYGMNKDEVDPALGNKAWVKIAKNRQGTIEKLSFETDLSTQSWIEFTGSFTYKTATSYPTNVKPAPKGDDWSIP